MEHKKSKNAETPHTDPDPETTPPSPAAQAPVPPESSSPPISAGHVRPPGTRDLKSLRIDPSQRVTDVRRVQAAVIIKKPNAGDFVRTRAGAENECALTVIATKGLDGLYVVAPEVIGCVRPNDVMEVLLVQATTPQGPSFLWPLRLPGADGRYGSWHESARAAASLAQTRWLRVQANMNLGAYDTLVALGDLSEPDWGDVPFESLVEIALKDRIIDSPDHPVLRRLRGEMP